MPRAAAPTAAPPAAATPKKPGRKCTAPTCPLPVAGQTEGTHGTREPKSPKLTFMLHAPSDMSYAGTYASESFRHAALKAASKGHERILLRRTNTKEIREYEGARVPLEAPKSVVRDGKTITYAFKPTARFVRSWIFSTPLDGAELDALAPPQ